jgi:hypothetical protein
MASCASSLGSLQIAIYLEADVTPCARPLCNVLRSADFGTMPTAARDVWSRVAARHTDTVEAIAACHPVAAPVSTKTLADKLMQVPRELHAFALRVHVVSGSLRTLHSAQIVDALPALTSLQHLHLEAKDTSPALDESVANALAQLTALRSLRVHHGDGLVATAIMQAVAPVTTLTALHLLAPELPSSRELQSFHSLPLGGF